MTMRRYEISLPEFFKKTREISYLQDVAMLFSVYYINTNKIPNYCKRCNLLCNRSNGDLST